MARRAAPSVGMSFDILNTVRLRIKRSTRAALRNMREDLSGPLDSLPPETRVFARSTEDVLPGLIGEEVFQKICKCCE